MLPVTAASGPVVPFAHASEYVPSLSIAILAAAILFAALCMPTFAAHNGPASGLRSFLRNHTYAMLTCFTFLNCMAHSWWLSVQHGASTSTCSTMAVLLMVCIILASIARRYREPITPSCDYISIAATNAANVASNTWNKCYSEAGGTVERMIYAPGYTHVRLQPARRYTAVKGRKVIADRVTTSDIYKWRTRNNDTIKTNARSGPTRGSNNGRPRLHSSWGKVDFCSHGFIWRTMF